MEKDSVGKVELAIDFISNKSDFSDAISKKARMLKSGGVLSLKVTDDSLKKLASSNAGSLKRKVETLFQCIATVEKDSPGVLIEVNLSPNATSDASILPFLSRRLSDLLSNFNKLLDDFNKKIIKEKYGLNKKFLSEKLEEFRGSRNVEYKDLLSEITDKALREKFRDIELCFLKLLHTQSALNSYWDDGYVKEFLTKIGLSESFLSRYIRQEKYFQRDSDDYIKHLCDEGQSIDDYANKNTLATSCVRNYLFSLFFDDDSDTLNIESIKKFQLDFEKSSKQSVFFFFIDQWQSYRKNLGKKQLFFIWHDKSYHEEEENKEDASIETSKLDETKLESLLKHSMNYSKLTIDRSDNIYANKIDEDTIYYLPGSTFTGQVSLMQNDFVDRNEIVKSISNLGLLGLKIWFKNLFDYTDIKKACSNPSKEAPDSAHLIVNQLETFNKAAEELNSDKSRAGIPFPVKTLVLRGSLYGFDYENKESYEPFIEFLKRYPKLDIVVEVKGSGAFLTEPPLPEIMAWLVRVLKKEKITTSIRFKSGEKKDESVNAFNELLDDVVRYNRLGVRSTNIKLSNKPMLTKKLSAHVNTIFSSDEATEEKDNQDEEALLGFEQPQQVMVRERQQQQQYIAFRQQQRRDFHEAEHQKNQSYQSVNNLENPNNLSDKNEQWITRLSLSKGKEGEKLAKELGYSIGYKFDWIYLWHKVSGSLIARHGDLKNLGYKPDDVKIENILKHKDRFVQDSDFFVSLMTVGAMRFILQNYHRVILTGGFTEEDMEAHFSLKKEVEKYGSSHVNWVDAQCSNNGFYTSHGKRTLLYNPFLPKNALSSDAVVWKSDFLKQGPSESYDKSRHGSVGQFFFLYSAKVNAKSSNFIKEIEDFKKKHQKNFEKIFNRKAKSKERLEQFISFISLTQGMESNVESVCKKIKELFKGVSKEKQAYMISAIADMWIDSGYSAVVDLLDTIMLQNITEDLKKYVLGDCFYDQFLTDDAKDSLKRLNTWKSWQREFCFKLISKNINAEKQLVGGKTKFNLFSETVQAVDHFFKLMEESGLDMSKFMEGINNGKFDYGGAYDPVIVVRRIERIIMQSSSPQQQLNALAKGRVDLSNRGAIHAIKKNYALITPEMDLLVGQEKEQDVCLYDYNQNSGCISHSPVITKVRFNELYWYPNQVKKRLFSANEKDRPFNEIAKDFYRYIGFCKNTKKHGCFDFSVYKDIVSYLEKSQLSNKDKKLFLSVLSTYITSEKSSINDKKLIGDAKKLIDGFGVFINSNKLHGQTKDFRSLFKLFIPSTSAVDQVKHLSIGDIYYFFNTFFFSEKKCHSYTGSELIEFLKQLSDLNNFTVLGLEEFLQYSHILAKNFNKDIVSLDILTKASKKSIRGLFPFLLLIKDKIDDEAKQALFKKMETLSTLLSRSYPNYSQLLNEKFWPFIAINDHKVLPNLDQLAKQLDTLIEYFESQKKNETSNDQDILDRFKLVQISGVSFWESDLSSQSLKEKALIQWKQLCYYVNNLKKDNDEKEDGTLDTVSWKENELPENMKAKLDIICEKNSDNQLKIKIKNYLNSLRNSDIYAKLSTLKLSKKTFQPFYQFLSSGSSESVNQILNALKTINEDRGYIVDCIIKLGDDASVDDVSSIMTLFQENGCRLSEFFNLITSYNSECFTAYVSLIKQLDAGLLVVANKTSKSIAFRELLRVFLYVDESPNLKSQMLSYVDSLTHICKVATETMDKEKVLPFIQRILDQFWLKIPPELSQANRLTQLLYQGVNAFSAIKQDKKQTGDAVPDLCLELVLNYQEQPKVLAKLFELLKTFDKKKLYKKAFSLVSNIFLTLPIDDRNEKNCKELMRLFKITLDNGRVDELDQFINTLIPSPKSFDHWKALLERFNDEKSALFKQEYAFDPYKHFSPDFKDRQLLPVYADSNKLLKYFRLDDPKEIDRIIQNIIVDDKSLDTKTQSYIKLCLTKINQFGLNNAGSGKKPFLFCTRQELQAELKVLSQLYNKEKTSPKSQAAILGSIAIIREVMRRVSGKCPKLVQLLPLLLVALFDDKSIAFEVESGQGKTIISAQLMAFLKAVMGFDINHMVSSSRDLVERDKITNAAFFDYLFGDELNVQLKFKGVKDQKNQTQNEQKEDTDSIEPQKAQSHLFYSTTSELAFQQAEDFSNGKLDIDQKEPPTQVAVFDEGDSDAFNDVPFLLAMVHKLNIDDKSSWVQIYPAINKLVRQAILNLDFDISKDIKDSLALCDKKQLDNIRERLSKRYKNKQNLTKFEMDLENELNWDRTAHKDKGLCETLAIQPKRLLGWIMSSFQVQCMLKDSDYAVHKAFFNQPGDSEKQFWLTPKLLDKGSRVTRNVLARGGHQLLTALCEARSEEKGARFNYLPENYQVSHNNTTHFIQRNFLANEESRFYILTGTAVGAEPEKQYLKKNLNPYVIKIPRAQKSKAQCLGLHIVKTNKEKEAKIKTYLKQFAKEQENNGYKGKRPIWLFRKDFRDANLTYNKFLNNKNIKQWQYTVKPPLLSINKKSTQELSQNDILFVTSSAYGRGADPSPRHKDGLFVIVSSITNSRDTKQVIKRAARWDKAGGYAKVLSVEDIRSEVDPNFELDRDYISENYYKDSTYLNYLMVNHPDYLKQGQVTPDKAFSKLDISENSIDYPVYIGYIMQCITEKVDEKDLLYSSRSLMISYLSQKYEEKINYLIASVKHYIINSAHVNDKGLANIDADSDNQPEWFEKLQATKTDLLESIHHICYQAFQGVFDNGPPSDKDLEDIERACDNRVSKKFNELQRANILVITQLANKLDKSVKDEANQTKAKIFSQKTLVGFIKLSNQYQSPLEKFHNQKKSKKSKPLRLPSINKPFIKDERYNLEYDYAYSNLYFSLGLKDKQNKKGHKLSPDLPMQQLHAVFIASIIQEKYSNDLLFSGIDKDIEDWYNDKHIWRQDFDKPQSLYNLIGDTFRKNIEARKSGKPINTIESLIKIAESLLSFNTDLEAFNTDYAKKDNCLESIDFKEEYYKTLNLLVKKIEESCQAFINSVHNTSLNNENSVIELLSRVKNQFFSIKVPKIPLVKEAINKKQEALSLEVYKKLKAYWQSCSNKFNKILADIKGENFGKANTMSSKDLSQFNLNNLLDAIALQDQEDQEFQSFTNLKVPHIKIPTNNKDIYTKAINQIVQSFCTTIGNKLKIKTNKDLKTCIAYYNQILVKNTDNKYPVLKQMQVALKIVILRARADLANNIPLSYLFPSKDKNDDNNINQAPISLKEGLDQVLKHSQMLEKKISEDIKNLEKSLADMPKDSIDDKKESIAQLVLKNLANFPQSITSFLEKTHISGDTESFSVCIQRLKALKEGLQKCQKNSSIENYYLQIYKVVLSTFSEKIKAYFKASKKYLVNKVNLEGLTLGNLTSTLKNYDKEIKHIEIFLNDLNILGLTVNWADNIKILKDALFNSLSNKLATFFNTLKVDGKKDTFRAYAELYQEFTTSLDKDFKEKSILESKIKENYCSIAQSIFSGGNINNDDESKDEEIQSKPNMTDIYNAIQSKLKNFEIFRQNIANGIKELASLEKPLEKNSYIVLDEKKKVMDNLKQRLEEKIIELCVDVEKLIKTCKADENKVQAQIYMNGILEEIKKISKILKSDSSLYTEKARNALEDTEGSLTNTIQSEYTQLVKSIYKANDINLDQEDALEDVPKDEDSKEDDEDENQAFHLIEACQKALANYNHFIQALREVENALDSLKIQKQSIDSIDKFIQEKKEAYFKNIVKSLENLSNGSGHKIFIPNDFNENKLIKKLVDLFKKLEKYGDLKNLSYSKETKQNFLTERKRLSDFLKSVRNHACLKLFLHYSFDFFKKKVNENDNYNYSNDEKIELLFSEKSIDPIIVDIVKDTADNVSDVFKPLFSHNEKLSNTGYDLTSLREQDEEEQKEVTVDNSTFPQRLKKVQKYFENSTDLLIQRFELVKSRFEKDFAINFDPILSKYLKSNFNKMVTYINQSLPKENDWLNPNDIKTCLAFCDFIEAWAKKVSNIDLVKNDNRQDLADNPSTQTVIKDFKNNLLKLTFKTATQSKKSDGRINQPNFNKDTDFRSNLSEALTTYTEEFSNILTTEKTRYQHFPWGFRALCFSPTQVITNPMLSKGNLDRLDALHKYAGNNANAENYTQARDNFINKYQASKLKKFGCSVAWVVGIGASTSGAATPLMLYGVFSDVLPVWGLWLSCFGASLLLTGVFCAVMTFSKGGVDRLYSLDLEGDEIKIPKVPVGPAKIKGNKQGKDLQRINTNALNDSDKQGSIKTPPSKNDNQNVSGKNKKSGKN